jgi:hypothetical protein
VKRGLLLGLTVAGLWGAVATVAADAARQRLAVLGIEPRSDDPHARQRTAVLARALTDELRARALDTGLELAPGSQKDLVELKLLTSCIDEAPACMATIGHQLGADIVIYGHLDKQRSGYVVSLNRLEVATRTVRALDTPKTVIATEDGMRKIAAATLTSPAIEAAPGEGNRLVVSTSVPATVAVNGIARGTTGADQPLAVNDLPAGPATVTVEAPGYRRYEGQVAVAARGRTDLTVRLERAGAAPAPAPEPEAPVVAERPGKTARVMFWTTLVATGVGVTAFTITGLQVRSIEQEQDSAIAAWGDGYKTNGVQFPNDACAEARNDGYQKLIDVCDRGQRMATVTNVLIGVTAAAAVASAIFYWRGYLASGNPEPAAVAHGPVIAPELYKSGAGVGATIEF